MRTSYYVFLYALRFFKYVIITCVWSYLFTCDNSKCKMKTCPLYRSRIMVKFSSYNFDFKSRHISHVTKSCIFKNLNLRRKVARNFLENYFRHLKSYSNSSNWLVIFWMTAESWSSRFLQRETFGFCYAGVKKTKEDLSLQKQVFLLSLGLCLTQKPKIWSLFYWKCLFNINMSFKS